MILLMNKMEWHLTIIVIRNGNKILVQKDDRAKHLTLPGGRCSLGENSVETALREFKEETGIDTRFKNGIGIVENFFTSSFTEKNSWNSYNQRIGVYRW